MPIGNKSLTAGHGSSATRRPRTYRFSGARSTRSLGIARWKGSSRPSRTGVSTKAQRGPTTDIGQRPTSR
jgi:hypothetical protein